MTDDLVEFLRARLDEEAEVADRENRLSGTWWDNKAGEADSMLVGMFSPARVLRDIEAKRRIIDLHSAPAPDSISARAYSSWPYHCEGCGYVGDAGEDPVTEHVDECPILRLLALPYADHPDYRQEWKP